MKEQLGVARREEGDTEKHAQKLIRNDEEDRSGWVRLFKDVDDPWAESLYDIPTLGEEKSVTMIQEQVKLLYSVLIDQPGVKKIRAFLMARQKQYVDSADFQKPA